MLGTALQAVRCQGAVARRCEGLPVAVVPAIWPLLRPQLVQREGRGLDVVGSTAYRLAGLLLLLP